MADPAVFLDRDGTLIEDAGYASRPGQIRILGGVARALSALAGAGYKLIVVTNQSALARGLMTEEDLHRFHQALDDQLDVLGARVDAYYTCPHHPGPAGENARPDLVVECDCRKPRPGLLLRAAEDLHIDLAASWMVGDTWRDVAAGQAAGVRTIKLPADAAHDAPRPPDVGPPTAEAEDLASAARIILSPAEAAAPAPAPPVAEEPAPREAPAPHEEPPPAVAQEPAAWPPPPPQEEPASAVIEEPAAHEEPAPAVLEEPAPPEEPAPAQAEAEPAAVARAPEPPPALAPVPSPEPVEEPEPEAPPAAETAVVAALEPPPPPRAEVCARCGQDVSAQDLARGAAARRDGLLLCPECLAQQPRDVGDRLPDDTVELLRTILLELRRAGRTQRPSSLTFLRLLAYLVQAGALFCGLVLGLISEDKAMFLQIAILLQLVVIVLLLLERPA